MSVWGGRPRKPALSEVEGSGRAQLDFKKADILLRVTKSSWNPSLTFSLAPSSPGQDSIAKPPLPPQL